MMVPKRVHSLTNPPKDKLIELLAFMQRCDPNGQAFSVLLPLMSITPHRRLTVNLKVMLERMAFAQIRNVLEDGLLDEEKTALLELELQHATDDLLGVAHGLLNVHERWFLLKSIGSKFRSADERADDFLKTEDLLKDILEDSDG